MQRSGVIFDLDGTLWDVTDTTLYSANEVAKKYGLPPVSRGQVKSAFGQPKEGSARIFFPGLPREKAIPLIDEVIFTNTDNLFSMGGELYPGLRGVLEKLSEDYSLFIVTNSPLRRYAESFMHYSGTRERFTEYYSAGELGLTKAQAIKKTVDDFGLSKAVYVGDTSLDADAAAEAGVAFIYAKYGFGDADHGCGIDSLFELPGAVARVLGR